MNVMVEELIRESRTENRVVRAPWSEPLAAALYEACDDGGYEVQYWGAGYELQYWGPDWRVHLVKDGAS